MIHETMYLLCLNIIMWFGNTHSLIINEKQQNRNFSTSCLNRLVESFPEIKYIYTVNLDLELSRPIIKLNLAKEKFTWFQLERSELIIIDSNDDDLKVLLKKLSEKPIFNPRSYIIVITKKKQDEIFRAASDYHIHRLIVIEKFYKRVQKLYSYRPYRNENVNTPELTSFVWGTCFERNFIKKMTTFKNNFDLPVKWRNTTIIALNNFIPPYVICPACTKNRGIEIETFDEIVKHLQVQVSYTRNYFDYWGSKANGSYSHILGELQRREGDMTIGVFHSKFEEHIDFDMSFTYMEDGTRWLVPKAGILPHWKRISLIFTKEVYVSLFVSFLIVLSVCRILYNTSFSSSWIVFYQILLESSVKQLPFSFRTITMIWASSCLILSTMFKSKLIDIMSKTSYEHQISTLSDIVESKLEILLDHDVATFYNYQTNDDEKYIWKNYAFCIHPRICINRTAFVQDCVTVDFQRSNEFFLPSFVDSQGDILIHLFDTFIFPVHIHLFFVKGYPIFPQINQLLMRMRSNGIIKHFYDNAGYNARRAMSKKSIFKAEVLSLEQMQIAFFIWGVGLLFSVMVFLIESLRGIIISSNKI